MRGFVSGSNPGAWLDGEQAEVVRWIVEARHVPDLLRIGRAIAIRINHRAIDPGEDTTLAYDMSIIGDCTDIDEAAACDPWVMALAPGVAHAHRYDRERDTDLLTDDNLEGSSSFTDWEREQ